MDIFIRLNTLHESALKNLRHKGNYKPFSKMSDRNDKIMKGLFDKLLKGQIDTLSFVSDDIFRCLHRSTEDSGKIQYSFGFYKDGNLIPWSHASFDSAEDFVNYGYPTGVWKATKI